MAQLLIAHVSTPAVPAAPAAVPEDEARLRTRGIIAFLAISFGLAWLPFLALLLGHGPAGAILMPFAPAIACVMVRKWVTREGFVDAGLRPNLRRWPLYLVAVAWPLAVHPVRVLLAFLLGTAPPGFTIPWGLAAPEPLTVLTGLLLPLVAVPIFLGEELGWRGYLQLRLFPEKPVLAALATGVLWAVWHYPWLLAGGASLTSANEGLLLYPVALALSSLFLGWLRLRSDSVWVPGVAHAANNGLADNLARLAFTGSLAGALPGIAAVPSLLAEALVFGALVIAIERVSRAPREWRGSRAWGHGRVQTT